MGLQGNLATMMLPDVLQWLSQNRKTGILHLRNRAGISKRIYFEAGAIVSTASSDPREYLGQFLISRGHITEEQLNKAMETQLQTGIKLGKVLVTVGILEEDDLEAMLRLKAQENLFDLFLWEEGEFRFEDRAALDEDTPRTQLDVMSMVMEGIRRKDEWERIRAAFPSDHVVLDKTDKKPGKDALPPNTLEAGAYALLDGERSLGELVMELHTTPFQLSEALYRLQSAGLVGVVGEKLPPEEATYAQMERGFLEEAVKALDEKRYQEAANLYRFLARHSPDDEEIRRGLELAEEALSQSFFKEIMPTTTVLELAIPLEQLSRQDLTPQEGYLASRVNGSWDIASILKVSPLSERDALRAIRKLLERGILRPKSRG